MSGPKSLLYEVGRSEIKSTKPYDFKKLYCALHDFFYEEGYAKDWDGGFPETFFWESRGQPRGTEYWIWWRGIKGANGFIQRQMAVDLHGVGVKDQEIMYGGKRVKIQSGKFEVLIKARLEIDPNGEWRNSKLGFLFELFWKRLYRRQLENHKKEMVEDLQKIQDFARNFMGLPTLAKRSEPFYPRLGYEEQT